MIATNRQQAHELPDRLPSDQMNTAVRFLEFLLLEDEEIGAEEEAAVARSKEWFQHNEGIPFEELVSDLGFSVDEVRKGSKEPAA
jgi:hypothetical protein